MAAHPPPPWQERHDTIRDVLLSKSVRAAARDFQISHTSIRSTGTQHSDTSKSDGDLSPVSLGKLLDIGLVIAWSADGLSPTRDPNPFRAAACPSLQYLRQASLQTQDFKTIKVLQKSAGSLVEVVKNRLDGRVYVLKSLVKGFARRNAAIQTPINETRLLQRHRSDHGTNTTTGGGQALQLLTPQLLAAFQTHNSVHVLMEYVPSGDFSELLMAASSCGAEYPGRAPTGLLTEDWILRYSVDMIQAIAWVHAQGFAHRDIKPGNFLLDTSGHLKLCDFSSAAPFSDFEITSNSSRASRPSRARRPSPSTERKVWAFYCSQPTGTCDYLSPEVLEAEEQKALERQKQCDMSSLDDILGLKRQSFLPSSHEADQGPQKVAGMYGPEVDWWSFGVMLYEMRLGILPFFASKMEETYEKIKNHNTSLTFDPSIRCSMPLRSLIQSLVTAAELRLGRKSSEEIQQHAFYAAERIDWSKQWPLQPPFMPNANVVDLQTPNAAMAGSDAQQVDAINGIAARLRDNSLSVVSSLPSFSALYSGDPDDFPVFADSRELESESFRQQQDVCGSDASPANKLENSAGGDLTVAPCQEAAAAADAAPCGMSRSSSSPAVVLNVSSQSITLRDSSAYMPGASSPHVSRSAPRWSDCDVTFIGFSYLPHREAFSSVEDCEALPPGEISTAASLDDFEQKSEASPSGWPAGTPVASTPFHRASGQSSHSLTMLPTPPSFAPSPVAHQDDGTGQYATANPARPSTMPFTQQQSFVTPARKPSYVAMHERLRQLHGQEAPIPEDALANLNTPAVPPSPYPFPVASVAHTSKFTGGKKPLLYRRDLDRARSATPGGGSVGSDSRQSGGSNAVREMSEREAWDEMMAAVQKSVRKKQPVAPVPPTPVTASAVRPGGLPPSSTDPQLSASKPTTTQPSRRTQLQAGPEVPASRRASTRRALQALRAPRQVSEQSEPVGQDRGEQPTLAAKPSVTLRQRKSQANLIAPRATFKLIPPESPRSSSPLAFLNESPHFGAIPQSQYAMDIDMYSSDASDDSTGGRRKLRHKKSARQLLIRAQERGTPTKPNRAQSPPLTEAYSSAPSVAAVLEATCAARSSSPILLSDQSARSCHSSRDVSHEGAAEIAPMSHRVRSSSIQYAGGKVSPDISNEVLSSSLGKTSVTFAPMAYVPVLGAIPPWRDGRDGTGSSDGHGDALGAARDPSRSAKTIRRKDSGEMLSQYRNAKGMGRATSMLSLSERAKADAEAPPSSRPGTALSSSSRVAEDGEDDFILGHVESRMRSMIPGGSLPGRTIRRFSSVLSLKERDKVTIERPASQDGTSKTTRGFGRFRSRLTSSTLCEEPTEELAAEEVKAHTDKLGSSGTAHGTTAATDGRQSRYTSTRLGRKMGDTLPRSFALRESVTGKRSGLAGALKATRDDDSVAKADVSLMTGLDSRHSALQGSLMGLEQRLARLKARLEE